MKKLIAMVGVAVVLTGCSGDFNMKANPDEKFDADYQGSPEIDLENAKVEEVIVEPTPVVEVESTTETVEVGTTEATATGATIETATGSAAVETKTETDVAIVTSTGAGM